MMPCRLAFQKSLEPIRKPRTGPYREDITSEPNGQFLIGRLSRLPYRFSGEVFEDLKRAPIGDGIVH
jgi:hypothetical protein